MSNINDISRNWVGETINALISKYDAKGLRASGDYAKSLEPVFDIKPRSLNIKILAAKHSLYMQEGRKPNENQDPDAIRKWVGWAGSTFLKEWVQNKGISVNPYAVAYKIAREGVNVPNQYNDGGVVSEVITANRINDLLDRIGLVLSAQVKSDVLRELKI